MKLERNERTLILGILRLDDVIDVIDNGYNNDVIFEIVNLKNEMFNKLSDDGKKLLQLRYEFREKWEEEMES